MYKGEVLWFQVLDTSALEYAAALPPDRLAGGRSSPTGSAHPLNMVVKVLIVAVV